MRSLFRFLLRNYFLMMFLALEAISLVLIVSFNNYQRVTFFNSSNVLTGTVYEKFSTMENYISLNKGSRQGIKPDMGIICAGGVVGVITNVSPNYSTGLSLLNKRLSIPAKINKNNYFGSLVWDGEHFNTADLKEIPFHNIVNVGDTVVTSGFSSVFPEGIMIGTIKNFDVESGTNFYNIKVELSTNFKTLKYVEVVQNTKQTELMKLESNNITE